MSAEVIIIQKLTVSQKDVMYNDLVYSKLMTISTNKGARLSKVKENKMTMEWQMMHLLNCRIYITRFIVKQTK